MARKPIKIELDAQERGDLENMVNSRMTPQGMAQRASVVLLAEQGKSNDDIARELNVHRNFVSRWRGRFRWKRIEGLKDEPGKGQKRTYGHDARLKVIAKSCEKPPEAQRWTVRDIAAALSDVGISKTTVGRILKSTDLKPHQTEQWMTSRDPDFEAKSAEICGLYLNPPENALVVCVDEKTGIQALSRVNPDKPERPGSPRKREFEYERHGPVSLFAAFVVHNGQVIGEVEDRHARVEFLRFLDRICAETPTDKMIYVILDNLMAHKTQEVKDWLASHPRFEFHYTPTHASWLNQVEMWFSILARRLVNDGIFDSKEELVRAIMDFITKYNERGKPFRWTYASDPLHI